MFRISSGIVGAHALVLTRPAVCGLPIASDRLLQRNILLRVDLPLNIVNYSQGKRPMPAGTGPKLNTAAAARKIGVSKATLLRWFKQGKIAEVGRDRNGWRVFTATDVARIRKHMGMTA